MFTKPLFLLLGYIIYICGSTKQYNSHFIYDNMGVKERCDNYWLWKLVCDDHSHPFSANETFINHQSYESQFNKHTISKTNNSKKKLTCSCKTFKNFCTSEEVVGFYYKNINFTTKTFLSVLMKSEFQNSGTVIVSDGRKQLINISNVVRNVKVNVPLNYMSCVEPKKEISLLFIWSDILLYYVGSRNFPTQITLHRTAARIIDQKIFDVISNVTNIFNVMGEIFTNCILSQHEETIFLTKSSFLWFKVDEPYSFQNLSGVFQKRSSFFKINPQLQKELAKNIGLISVQFMTSENLVKFSYKNFVSVSQLMLLSIKRGENQIVNLTVPVDLFFKYQIDARSEQLFQGTSQIPPNYESLLDKDKLVTVYKLMPFHFPGSGKIIIKFYNLSLTSYSLKVVISIDTRPDWETMILYSTVISAKYPIFETTLENQTKTSIIYLGITSASTVPETIEYSFEVRYYQCYSKFDVEWKSDGCDVGAETNETIIHCQCRHLSLFGGGVAIAPRQIDFKQDIKLLYLVGENPRPCILVLSIILLYLVIMVWTRHNDRKDQLQRFVVVLHDNFPGEEWPYLLTVYTSFWIGSGTEAKIGVRLYGSKGISRIHILNNVGRQRKVLKANCDDWFLIFTPKNLGEIEKIHIFSDFTGVNPDWYCRKMMLYDLEGQKEFKFVIEKWVSLAEEDECVDFICYPISTKKSLRRDRIALDNIIFGLQETHLLFSIFTRHPRSSVTRSQRLSICICILLVHLLTSNIFHESELPEFPQYSETKRKLVIQMESTLIASPFTFIVIFCFKKSRIITVLKNNIPMTLTSTQAVPLETGLEINQDKRAISQTSNNLTETDKQPNEFACSFDSLGEETDETEEEMGEEEVEEEEVEEEEEEKEIEEGCVINCYKQICALIFQVIVSKTIMPVKIAEEDEESSRIRIRWMYFAWLLCEFAIFGSAFLVIMYSLKMKHEVSSEWMLSSIKYSLTNIFFMAPLKIIVFALILAGLYGQLHYIPSYECNTEAAVKRELVGNQKFLSRLLAIRKYKCYKPLNSRKTQEIRSKQKNWRRWRILINFFVVAFLFFLLLLEVEVSWHGLYTVTYAHQHEMFDPRQLQKPITNFKSYTDYLTKVVIPAYDKRSWYNGDPIMTPKIWKQETSFMKDYATRLIGEPHLRQQRVKPESCVIPTVMADKLGFQRCYASITWSNIDKRRYSVSWTKPGKLIDDDGSNSSWAFANLKNSPMTMCGHKTRKCYMAGGYTANLGLKGVESKAIVNKLTKEEWFDGYTRVLFFEIVTYNVNSDIISSVIPMLEKLADGSFFLHIKTISLRPLSDGFATTLFILLTFTFYYFIRIVLLFNRKGLKYLLSWTGLIDIFISMLLYATIVSLFFNEKARMEYLHNWQLREENDLQLTDEIFLHRSLIKYDIGLILILTPIQLLHNFRFGKNFFDRFRTLSYCSKYAVGISLVIAMFYAFSIMSSAIIISKPIQCLYNRIYNPITYCTGRHSLAYQVEFFTFIFWFMANIAAFVACVTTIYGYKWMRGQNKYTDDFDMVNFFWGKINKTRKKIVKILFRARGVMIRMSPKRVRAGADTINVEGEEINLINKPLSYTKIMLNEMNMKFDNILDKLRDLAISD